MNYYYVIKVARDGTKASIGTSGVTFSTVSLSWLLVPLIKNCSADFCFEAPISELVKLIINASYFFDYVSSIGRTS